MLRITSDILRRLLSWNTRPTLNALLGTSKVHPPVNLTPLEYEKISNDTLENLAEVFDKIGEDYSINEFDVQHAYGVLKIDFGPGVGTYIINRQAPNKQLWLSSPRSGPKRYDYNPCSQDWIYNHDGTTLHRLLEQEVSEIVKARVYFPKSPNK